MIDYFVRGGPVMYPLLFCSIVALTVIIERSLFWILEDMHRNQALVDRVMDLCRVGDWNAVRERVKGSGDYVIRILVSGILHREFSMVKAMEAAAAVEMQRMRRHLAALDTMITVTPLLGIFGTVTGIVRAFEVLGDATIAIHHPEAVTAGLAEALITTVAGLAIAIPSVCFFNYFSSRVEKAATTIERYATNLEILYEKLCQGTMPWEGGNP
ncbi:MAG: MotA/TolQ/ExbB proton channel family protein [Desulfobacteraceae bacterium]|nr:MAG: MotA/TolQ/ExbB proton channel family protein [Desulfobacteraceae bacterium]